MSPIRTAWASAFLEARVLTEGDVYAVALAAERYGESDPQVLLGLAFAVRAPRMGHAGVNLASVSLKVTTIAADGAGDHAEDYLQKNGDDDAGPAAELPAGLSPPPLPWPDPSGWLTRSLGSSMVGGPGDTDRPFVHQQVGDQHLLLTRRMYQEQARVAAAIRARAQGEVPDSARVPELEGRITELFSDRGGESARALRLAERKRLAIIVGGPGTGKTFSICRLLAVILSTPASGPLPIIALAAPTGKAAARVGEAIREATASDASPMLKVTPEVRAAIQRLRPKTLHKLLGVRPDGSCRHSRETPLVADVVIIDEVSMVDLAMMRRLLEAVPDSARLILLGDRDQLASVEAGCVLADLVAGALTSDLGSCVQSFTESRRFKDAPSIARIAACLQSGPSRFPDLPVTTGERIALAVRAMDKTDNLPDHERITWLGSPHRDSAHGAARPSHSQLDQLARPYMAGSDSAGATQSGSFVGYAALLREALESRDERVTSPDFHARLLRALDRYRVLAVHRRGALGVSGLEEAITARIRDFLPFDREVRDWIGRPILVTENAYDVELMNGDVGMVLPTSRDRRRCAVFAGAKRGEVRAVALARLPRHQGALVMTVHKAQGSQFDRVAMVLAGRASPIQTRELVYTGVTRAVDRLDWLGESQELAEALATSVERASGLEPLLTRAL